MATLRVINERVLIKNQAQSFYAWKFVSLVDRKAQNRKMQMYFLDHAKQEVRRS